MVIDNESQLQVVDLGSSCLLQKNLHALHVVEIDADTLVLEVEGGSHGKQVFGLDVKGELLVVEVGVVSSG